ncbi:MAG: hypothetical protein IRZ03_11740 [Acidobacterium ailaaui]|nr:hypothetical protein [Pseudacidobacterium ailaaui]
MKTHAVPFEVYNENEVDVGIARVEKTIGKIYILVNNVDTIIRNPIIDTDLSEFRKICGN